MMFLSVLWANLGAAPLKTAWVRLGKVVVMLESAMMQISVVCVLVRAGSEVAPLLLAWLCDNRMYGKVKR